MADKIINLKTLNI